MIQNTFLTLICILATGFIIFPIRLDATCNLCSDYGIACINETSFHICSDGQPRTQMVYTCPSKTLCSNSSLRCIDESSDEKPACQPNKGCGICNRSKIFACTSRTTFVQCDGETVTKKSGECPKDWVCDSNGGEICKNECNRPTVLECDIDAPL